jgi:RNA polymerase sigma-70 factor (ECF subfamily)
MASIGPATDATRVLTSHLTGDIRATSRLLVLVCERLKKLAAHFMRAERPDHTLQPTAVVYEAYIRLIDRKMVDWRGKSLFFAKAARKMWSVLVEHAWARSAQKRGAILVTLVDAADPAHGQIVDVLSLEQSLEKLAAVCASKTRVFGLHFYVGLNVRATAQFLDVSERLVKGDWKVSRAWLARQLYHSASGVPS